MNQTIKTIGQMFLERTNKSGPSRAIGYFAQEDIQFLTYEKYHDTVRSLAMGLKEIGVVSDTKVAILSNTRKEWHLLDMGILTSRGVTVPIYQTYTKNEIEYILKHSDSNVLAVENEEQLKKVLLVQNQLSNLTHILLFDPVPQSLRDQIKSDIQVYTFDEFFKLGETAHEKDPKFFAQNIKAQQGNEVASIIYTSGTTADPKGVVITHEAFIAMLNNIAQVIGNSFHSKDRTLTWLPLSHVFGRCESMLYLVFGWEMIFAQGIEQLIDNLNQAKPTALLAVPRIFEKIYAKIMNQINSGSLAKKAIFNWANTVSSQYHDKLDQDLSPSISEILQAKLAYKLVFKKIYNRFGGKIRYFISGGAPISPQIIKFLRNANLPILEGYGLTETVAPCTINPTEKQIPGTVGIPVGDVEIRIADDGEILIKSKSMLREYYKDPVATAEAIKEGWFHSGDIGEFTKEGYLKITDRKKDLIVTSGGKNIVPQKIEGMLKLQKHITHSVIVGDRRNFLTALIGIERETFTNMTNELGLDDHANVKAIATSAKVQGLIETDVSEVNKQLPSFETIKKFYVVPEEFTVDNGFITPSLKVKKKSVMKAYQEEIDKMYQSRQS